ncbi:PBSX family phage terminase large subunit [Marinobacterium litorale]|uniref:PBSX family phage terminase large subunit n=1 Tax=Marinobacterium litorale TaxID=404770 RepID=UPI00041EFE9A|nr:PBSX family phage terminase large subunit [Marinobacterium litorale]
MASLDIPTARVFVPLLEPARYKGAWGGRGSGKSHFFAELLVEEAIRRQGLRAVCIREVQKSLKESAKKLIEDKIQQHGVGAGFEILNDQIKTPGGGVVIFQGMQDHTAESIKSLEGFDVAWVEEAQTLSATSLKLLRPTIRKEGSELWFSWNPRRHVDPVDELLRSKQPTNAVVVRANWSDNPWFPAVLEQERQDCLNTEPDQYDHIWEGGYIRVATGAYFAKHIAEARLQKRIGRVPRDPYLPVKLFCDIGGTGAKSDAFSIWAAQFVGHEIRVLNYYEAVGQELGHHLAWMRQQGYGPENAEIVLPHDGRQHDKVYKVSYQSAFKQAGYKVTVVPNQGAGAAAARIEEVRKRFPSIWINEDTCGPGLDALGWYHEKRDESRGIGLGPEHDWSSHGADAFGLMCVAYKPPTTTAKQLKYKIRRPRDRSIGY